MATASLHSVRKELADVIECAICTEIYTDPRSLPCVHTFCLKCLQQLGQDRLPGDDLECPLCRKKFVMPATGPQGLPKNFFMERMKLIKDLSATSDTNQNYCDECMANARDPCEKKKEEKKKLAITYCIDCQEKLCHDCDNVHKSLKATCTHKRVYLGDQISSVTFKDHSSLCDKHSDEKLKLFCTECKIVICMMCFVASHSSHKCLDINDIADEFRHQMSADVTNLADGIDTCRDILKCVLKDKQDFVTLIQRLEQHVNSCTKQLIEAIECHQQTILNELKSVQQQRLKQVDRLSQNVEQHVSVLSSLIRQYTEELCENGAAGDVGRETVSLHNRTDELLKFDVIQHALNELGSMSVSFASSEISQMLSNKTANFVGRIEVKKTAETVASIPVKKQCSAKTIVEQSSYDASPNVAVSPAPPSAASVVHIFPGDHGVRGLTMLRGRLFVASSRYIEISNTATFAQQQQQQQQRIYIQGLSIGRDGGIVDLASCDVNNCIYVSDWRDKAVYKVTPSDGNKQIKWRLDGYPWGLSVNKENNVIITFSNKIVEYKTDGSLVRTVYLPCDMHSWHSIQLTSGQYTGQFLVCHGGRGSYGVTVVRPVVDSRHVVSDCRSVITASYNNEKDSTSLQFDGPRHLAVNKRGFIFVADCWNDRIVVLSPMLDSSRVLSVQILFGGLCRPYRMYLDDTTDVSLFVGEQCSGRVLMLNIAE